MIAYLETEVDPLEFSQGHFSCSHDENLISELTRRVHFLEERVRVLSNSEALGNLNNRQEGRRLKKKNRRRFKDLVRDQKVIFC